MSTNIPEAREHIAKALATLKQGGLSEAFPEIVGPAEVELNSALDKMTRTVVNKPQEHTRTPISIAQRADIMRYRDTGHSCAEVAYRVLGRAEASGRVSEIWTEGK